MLVSNNKKRVMSVFSLVMINVIAIDSLRNLPTNAETGLSVALFYIIGTILFLVPCALVTAELATNYPKTGGVYVWVREAFGEKWGFLNIWLQWIYNVVWYPTILAFLAANIAYLINPALANNKIYMISMIIGLFALGTLINLFGMKLSSLLSSVSAILGTILPMLFIIALGVVWIFQGHPLAIKPSWDALVPKFNNIDNFTFLVIILFSLVGLEMSAVHAEEVKNPQRDYPRALLYSSLIIVLSLILASIAIAIIVPKTQLSMVSGLDQAFSDFLSILHLKWLMPITIILILIGGFGGMAAWVIGPTKGLMVAAEDGSLPKLFCYHNKKGVPVALLIMQFIIVLLLSGLFLLFKTINTSYWILSDLTAQLALLFYVILFAAAIRLRYKAEPKPNTYRIPGGKLGIWIVGGVGILTSIGAIILGFFPPSSGVNITNIALYEAILWGGMIIFSIPPFLFYRFCREQRRKGESRR